MCVISVIIPVYNGEKYISTAIESVLKQPLINQMEIIIVNDGSTDSTESICQEYTSRFAQIHLISQGNQGVSIARNIGLKNAKGIYISFLDADDKFVDEVFDNKLLEEISQQYGVIMFSSYLSNMKRDRYAIDTRLRDVVVSGHRIFSTSGTFASCLYLREMLEENDIKFDAGVSLNEDQVFKLKALYAADNVRMMSKFCYVYNMTPDSIMHTATKGFDRVIAWQKAYEWFLEHGREQDLPQILTFIQIKIQARMLLYAKSFVQSGHGKNALIQELRRVDGYEMLMNINANQVMPYQREELKMFQTELDKFVRYSRMEGWKISAGRKVLKIPLVRGWRDKRKYPIKSNGISQNILL